ncbi:MAG: hypothetical protein UU77_C0035G0010 [candidate division WWE3 bacterium GW2011_GWC1_41_7]|jgi:ABC-type Fe3+-siderophore transport system permease subunit|uniref:Uncharacterized protein n=3 Tax=Katanobacteria TaxID=422282 RepID=A0A0G1AB03_UNCKA|nr:MAG: hypothetical protein UU72_C0009G0011 [candidate division WWE3 bacterium GW2011_GWB1_41_6]KKS19959.1 MAG: hypothetical protein UU77_C0035G0010 [candidate division WWE3 bacterium GW2011_GWC1_41_7]KKS22478.1 MAG: hypothetical protein UU80_C0006G0004 [candidate division WWE3 bacterium GW2011_GWA1_41_8]
MPPFKGAFGREFWVKRIRWMLWGWVGTFLTICGIIFYGWLSNPNRRPFFEGADIGGISMLLATFLVLSALLGGAIALQLYDEFHPSVLD